MKLVNNQQVSNPFQMVLKAINGFFERAQQEG